MHWSEWCNGCAVFCVWNFQQQRQTWHGFLVALQLLHSPFLAADICVCFSSKVMCCTVCWATMWDRIQLSTMCWFISGVMSRYAVGEECDAHEFLLNILAAIAQEAQWVICSLLLDNQYMHVCFPAMASQRNTSPVYVVSSFSAFTELSTCLIPVLCGTCVLIGNAVYCIVLYHRGDHKSRGWCDSLWSVLRPDQFGPLHSPLNVCKVCVCINDMLQLTL